MGCHGYLGKLSLLSYQAALRYLGYLGNLDYLDCPAIWTTKVIQAIWTIWLC